jgi:vitamin B12 transporter
LSKPWLAFDLPAGGRRLLQKADGYVAVNLAARWQVTQMFTLFARGDNVFDESYQNPVGFLGAERAFYVGVQAKL